MSTHLENSGRTADPGERIKAIMGDDFRLREGDSLVYEWHGGYERITHKYGDGGTLTYAGSYHPGDGACVGRGVCRYCGRTLFDE